MINTISKQKITMLGLLLSTCTIRCTLFGIIVPDYQIYMKQDRKKTEIAIFIKPDMAS